MSSGDLQSLRNMIVLSFSMTRKSWPESGGGTYLQKLAIKQSNQASYSVIQPASLTNAYQRDDIITPTGRRIRLDFHSISMVGGASPHL
jgi:hypothetical protein